MTSATRIGRRIAFVAALLPTFVACRPTPRNLGGEIHGFVSVGSGQSDIHGSVDSGPPIRVPNIRVTATNVASSAQSASLTTNVSGHFDTPRLASGRYQLCVEAPGFVSSCSSQVFDVGSENIILNFDLPIAPEPGSIHGRVMLADAGHVACFTQRQAYGTLTAGKVWLEGGGNQVAGPVTANSAGQYVLPKIPGPGTYQLRATCDKGNATRNVTLSGGDLSGGTSDLQIANHSPQLVSLTPTIGGKFARRASAGATVQLTVKASDVDGDPLHYEWVSDAPNFSSADSPTLNWTLPNASAMNVVAV